MPDLFPWRLVEDRHNGSSIVELNDHDAQPDFVCFFVKGRERSARYVVKQHNSDVPAWRLKGKKLKIRADRR